MKTKILWVLLGFAMMGGAHATAIVGERFSQAGYWTVSGSPRHVTRLNVDWDFSLDSFNSSHKVVLPHSIDEGEVGFEASGGVNRQQEAWYRRELSWTGGSARQFLHFEAIMGKSRVWLNGRLVAEHFGGFLPIHVEVTGVLRVGKNLLEVWCDNSDDGSYPPGKPQNQLDFTYWGGIYRDAYLIETGDAYVTDSGEGGVYVTSKLKDDGTWTITADTVLGGNVTGCRTDLFFDGRPVKSPFCLKSPETWSPEAPNLHLLRVEVRRGDDLLDAVGVRFGIRDFKLDDRGLTLNGKLYEKKLIGVNRHQDYAFIGMALSNSLHWRDVKKYKDCGMTCFRNAHYPQDPAFMDACDELGMFVIVNTPGWQFWNKTNPVFEQRVYEDIRNMVRRDRSRPSLLMWEPILNETRFPAAFVTNAVRIVKAETRAPNYCVCDGHSPGAGVCDVNYGMSSDPHKPLFCREWGDFPDDWNAQNSTSRVAWEWGETPQVAQAKHYMEEKRWPSLRQQQNMEPRHFGGTLWHGADHARGYHPDNFWGGILTYARQKKYSWHAFKAALSDKPYFFLAHELAPYSPHEMTVFANCSVDSTWLGSSFVQDVTRYDYDTVQKMTYDGDGKAVEFVAKLPNGVTYRKRPAQRFERILLELDSEGLAPRGDGCDLIAVVATLADRYGTPRRYSRETVRFEVEGPAEVVGQNPQPVRWGEVVVLLRLKVASAGERVIVRAHVDRHGVFAEQNGMLSFALGSCAVDYRWQEIGMAERSRLRTVEDQQSAFSTAISK